MSGVIAAAVVAHVPTLGRAEITPDFQQTLVQGERELGRKLRALKPDLWVIASTHWVSTFNWMATCQPEHRGTCIADEAPDLIPGIPYRYHGDAQFGQALVDAWKAGGVPAVANESPHYSWDYGTYVPLSHLDPDGEVPVVSIPSVLMADHAECLKAGAAIHATAQKLGRRVAFIASSALTHSLVRGRHHLPTPARIEADRQLIERLERGEIESIIAGFGDYSHAVVAEMGGRVLATLLGVLRAMSPATKPLIGRQFGEYAQSSGSGNANVVLADREVMTHLQ
jgi:3,4-dihydroxyphenylacetate 2,3-dioxygenase